MLFDKTNVTEFLRRWDIECDTFGLSAEERCVSLPLYCTPNTQDLIEVLPGYLSHDWALLKKDLKTLFSQYDKKKVTLGALADIMRAGASSTMELDVYII